MRTEWYGDNRDLVKWGTLIHLCRERSLKHISQVPFLCDENNSHKLSVDGGTVDFPKKVWSHFKPLQRIEDLGKQVDLRINVFLEFINHKKRQDYVELLF